MKKTNNYNGFKSENDYQYVLNIVKSVVDGNANIHTYAVSMDEKYNIIIILNDVRITEEGFDMLKFFAEHNVTIKEVLSTSNFISRTITKHLNQVIKQEGWK